MPSFQAEVPHALGQQAAREKLEGFLQKIGEKYKGQISHMEGTWQENVLNFAFSTFGIKISGKMTVENDRIVMDGELPFSAMMFKNKIVGGIQEALQKALA
jgi:putative polyhydroxyalkanoate system protein